MPFTIKERILNKQYAEETKLGYKVIRLFIDNNDNRVHAIIYKHVNKNFILALGYSTENGDWSLGLYFREFDDCVRYLYIHFNPHEIPFV